MTLMKAVLRDTELPNVAINLMSMFAPVVQNRPEIDPFSLQAAAPPALSYFMFPFIENISFVVSQHPPFATLRFARMHVAAAFFSPRHVASSLKSMQIFHKALFAARAFANHQEKSIPPASHSFPRHPVAVSFFHSVDAARRGGTWNEFITGDTTVEPLSRIRRF